MSTRTHERVHFRLFQMPCCGHLLCWVNPRFPNFCPECGNQVYAALKLQGESVKVSDPDATLTIDPKAQP